MRMGVLAASFTVILAASVHARHAKAFAEDASADCEEMARQPRRELLAAAAVALDPKDAWDRAKYVCVEREGRSAWILLVSGSSREPAIQHDVRCYRADRLQAWSCNKIRSDFLLEVNEREVVVDPRIALADARRIVTFFARYTGPELKLPNCAGGSLSAFNRRTFAEIELIYLDLDEQLTVSLGAGRIAIDQDALARGEVKPACWFVMSE